MDPEPVIGGDQRPEGLDEEHLGELVAHVGSAGFGVRELLAEKLKRWAESTSRRHPATLQQLTGETTPLPDRSLIRLDES